MEVKQKENKFYIEKDNQEAAKMTYHWKDDKLVIDSTEVAEDLRGQGVGKQLIKGAVAYARREDVTIIPVCPYAKKSCLNRAIMTMYYPGCQITK